MKGRRTGIVVRQNRDIRKDSNGFDDIDDFFAAATDPSRNSSILSTRSLELHYETSSAISEDESILSVPTAGSRESNISPKATPKLTPKPSPKQQQQPLNDPDDGDDDSPGFALDNDYDDFGYDDQPFDADESPLPTKSPSTRISIANHSDIKKSNKSARRRSSTASISEQKKPKATQSSKKRSLGSAAKATPVNRKRKSLEMQTPVTTPGDMSVISTPGTHDFPRAYALPDDTFEGESGDETDEDDGDTSFQPDTSSFLQSAKKRAALVSDETDDEGSGLRRSSRVTKGQTFKWWKGNERRIYKNGELHGVMEGAATPAPKYKKHGTKKKRGGGGIVAEPLELEPLDPGLLPDDLNILDTDELRIWDDIACEPSTAKVVCFGETLAPADLPITATRKPGKRGVSKAAQSFNMDPIAGQQSGWISGFALLPPQAIKDAEGVGSCSQVFFVANAQPKSLELAIASPDKEQFDDDTAQRVLLSPGDHFYIPPGNLYRLENHSTTTEIKIFWIIIKPFGGADEV